MEGIEERGPAIALRGLSFTYVQGAPPVLDGISLGLAAGAVAAILGPNGSGKTTLLKLLLGLLSPQEGQIEIAGRAHADHSRRELSRLLGLVPQEELVTFDLTVFEYVLLGRAPYLDLLEMPGDGDRRVALEALRLTGITALAGRAVPSLSGGERQLATLARALAQEPRILLLDEPMAHLDVANTRRILGVLRMLQEQERTIVLTTHDPNIAAAVADQVVMLREGRLVVAGSTAAVLNEENLSETYGVGVEVVEAGGRMVVIPW